MDKRMMNKVNQNLIDALQGKLEKDGFRRVINLITSKLREVALENSMDHSAGKVTFPEDFWQDLYDHLVTKKDGRRLANSTRKRYLALIRQVFEVWLKEGYVSEENRPSIRTSPQHSRDLSVSINGARNRYSGEMFRFEEFEKLLQTFLAFFNGSSSYPRLMDTAELQQNLLISCLLTGFVQSDPVGVLHALKWEDIPLEQDMPAWMPAIDRSTYKRRGGFWFQLAPLTHLLFLANRYRQLKEIKKGKNPKVFSVTKDLKALRRNAAGEIERWCQQASLPLKRLENLVQIERFHIRLSLDTNVHLAILGGMREIHPIPAEQVRQWLELSRNAALEGGFFLNFEASEDSQLDQNEEPAMGTRGEKQEEETAQRYRQMQLELHHLLGSFLQDVHTPLERTMLEEWSEVNNDHASIPVQNMAWLVKWLLAMKNKPQSRTTYWFAALRLLEFAPDLAVAQIDEEVIAGFLHSEEYAPSTLHLSKAAWKKFHQFMAEEGLSVAQIRWNRLQIKRRTVKTRIIQASEIERVLLAEMKTYLIWAIRLAYWAGLRVSEVCRLRACDLVLDGEPYLYIRRSKRGKRRRVRLTHLSEVELHWLQTLVEDRLALGLEAYLIVDEKGHSLESKVLSEQIGRCFQEMGLLKKGEGRAIRFHSLRSAGGERIYQYSGDLRYAAQQLGHSLACTTLENYLHTLDLQAAVAIRQWNNPLYSETIHLPVVVLAAQLGISTNHAGNYIDAYNAANPASPIPLKLPAELSDGPRPGRGGAPMRYICVMDAIRLVGWLVRKPEA